MTFRDLQETIARLANDPRIHPTTRIDLCYREWDDEVKCWEHETQALCAISLASGTLLFCTETVEPALTR